MKSYVWHLSLALNSDMSLYADTLHEIDQTLTKSLDVDEPLLRDIIRVASFSDYFYRFISTEDAQNLLKSSELMNASKSDGLSIALSIKGSMLVYDSIENFDVSLRKLRQREMCRIIFRDFTRRSDLIETTRDLSFLADFCVEVALDFHYGNNVEKLGRPLNESGELQKMCVLALGKLGARELNLSSDIDLMFFYGESGEVEGESGMSNQEFFLKTARQIINSLDTVLASGFVFRVDMRLRPYGESSPLIVNQTSLENYYVDQGRDWERYAFIKARPIAGDLQLGFDFLNWLLPFIYRKQLDYGAIEALREMKGLINIEVKRKDLLDDVKLGSGGIRECEFIVQSQQLVWGGKKTVLQQPRYLEALAALGNENLLPRDDVADLKAAYIFLRNTEHGIQGENDKQTQKLPSAELSRTRLALLMGESTYDDFLIKLDEHRNRVAACFESLLGSNSSEKEILVEGNLFWVSIWRDPKDEENLPLLVSRGFSDGRQVAEQLNRFKKRNLKLQEIALNRLNKLLPILLSLCASEETPLEALERCLKVFDAVTRRSTYLAFLLENKDALKNLVHLCAMSSWLVDRVSAYPILMYEFTDMKTEADSLDQKSRSNELQEIVSNIPFKDLEGQMDGLRQFKNAAQTKAATLELLDKLTVMKASDYLTNTAEIVLDRAVDLAFDYLVERHGEPCDRSGQSQGRCFAVIAYGKLGGIELAYGSDLDVVFLHDGDIQGETEGPKSVPNNMFFSRLGQRIVHILSSLTNFGLLYEVDLRLRPDGNKGPLVGTFNAYERYFDNEAWTWEHQALVRSRFVAGNKDYKARFDQIRNAVISKKRDPEQLRSEVKTMRAKMREHLGNSGIETGASTHSNVRDVELKVFDLPFNLKHSAGAIVDIEFLVQYLVLVHGHEYPVLSRWTDKVRLLETLASLGLISSKEAKVLHEAYLSYRAAVHYTWLGGKLVSFESLNAYRESVVDIWNRFFNEDASLIN